MSHRKGLHIAFFGPDGSGKSTVIKSLHDIYSATPHSVHVHHLFPGSGRGVTRSVDDPQGEEPRSALASILKMALWGWRYTIDYARFIRKPITQSSVVISDRYFPDIIVDPVRYRYGGPHWLPKIMWRVLPKPELMILLDAPAEILLERKQELPIAETRRQLLAYRELIRNAKNGHIVNADQPIEDVIADAERIVTGALDVDNRDFQVSQEIS